MDFVVFDLEYCGKIFVKMQMMVVDYSVFEGWLIEGCLSVVMVCGEVVVCDGKFCGMIGCGKFLKCVL